MMPETTLPITRYTPESRVRHPIALLKEMFRDLKDSRELAWRLVIRDISAQYRQTALGYFWAVFPPLVTSLVLILLKSSAIMDIKGIGIPYPAYVMMGTVFFQLFVDALNAPLKVVTESKAILTKINLPREAFILSGMGQVLFSFGIKIILLIGGFIYFKVHVSWTTVLLPIPLLGMLLLGTMMGVLLIPVGLLYKDIQSALLVATSGLVFLSPVAYPPTNEGILGKIMNINPITPLLMGAKNLVVKGIPGDLGPFFIVFAFTVLFLFIGWVVYRLALPIIIERIGA
ncbi:MAG: ABC transporter permease [Candidatus Aminicenantes bacterium]|nr:MAG: ABC transporter permease [Candidatus Aminicenantes bacterium]